MNVLEYYGSIGSGEIFEYEENPTHILTRKKHHSSTKFNYRSVKSFFKAAFLPQGYPDSVSQDYLHYQIWDTVQAFCSGITRTLATQAVLKGAGVGDETATAAGATITWLLKDGTGMVGRIAFAYGYGSSLDCNAKQWRMFADVLNDCAIFVELLAPLLPKSLFTFTMCSAGLAFSLVGVAGGCTRAALTMHQAKRNNMADVSAKDGSQETLVNLASLLISLIITPLLSENQFLVWFLFVLFTVIHIYANYRAVSCVVMDSFNRIRLSHAIHVFISEKRVISPKEANRQENILFTPSFNWLKIGCKLSELQLTQREFQENLEKNYLVRKLKNKVFVAFEHSASSPDMVKAFYEAYLLHIDKTFHQKDADSFLSSMGKHGWNLNMQQLCVDEWRYNFDSKSLKQKST